MNNSDEDSTPIIAASVTVHEGAAPPGTAAHHLWVDWTRIGTGGTPVVLIRITPPDTAVAAVTIELTADDAWNLSQALEEAHGDLDEDEPGS